MNKELRECKRGYSTRSGRKNSRRLLDAFDSFLYLYLYLSHYFSLSLFLSPSFSSEFQCGLPVISFNAADISRVSRIRVSRPCICRGTCIHASMYEDIPAHIVTTTARR